MQNFSFLSDVQRLSRVGGGGVGGGGEKLEIRLSSAQLQLRFDLSLAKLVLDAGRHLQIIGYISKDQFNAKIIIIWQM